MSTRIDPIDRQRRCAHDMLNGQCSWCKGLPDLPDLDEFARIDDAPALERPGTAEQRYVLVEHHGDCGACGRPLRIGQSARYVAGVLVGECCEVAA